MTRRFFIGRLPNAGLHPDQWLAPLDQEPEAIEVFHPSPGAKGNTETLHPDLDWDLAFADPLQEPALDVIDLAISLDELQEEEATALALSEPSEISLSEPVPAKEDIDWHLELAWAGASGVSSFFDDGDPGWETFDFDVADIGLDHEAQAEDMAQRSRPKRSGNESWMRRPQISYCP